MFALLSAAIVQPVAASQVGPYGYEVTSTNHSIRAGFPLYPYSINTSTGASTSIGSTGISQTGTFALSTGSSTLYATYGGELYTVDTSTLTAVGSTGLSTTNGRRPRH